MQKLAAARLPAHRVEETNEMFIGYAVLLLLLEPELTMPRAGLQSFIRRAVLALCPRLTALWFEGMIRE